MKINCCYRAHRWLVENNKLCFRVWNYEYNYHYEIWLTVYTDVKGHTYPGFILRYNIYLLEPYNIGAFRPTQYEPKSNYLELRESL